MTDIIFAYDDFRVRDHDGLNYVVEERSIIQSGKNEGQERWRNRGYCANGKSVYSVFERCLVQKYQEEATSLAKANLSQTEAIELNNLPSKKGDLA